MRLGKNFLTLTFSVHSHDTSLCRGASCLRFAEQECCADTEIVLRETVGRDVPISTGWGSCMCRSASAYHLSQHRTNKLKIKCKPMTLTPASVRSCCAPGPLQDAAPRHRRCHCAKRCAGCVSSEIEFPWPHSSQSIVFGSFVGDRPGLPKLAPISHQRVSISMHHPTQLLSAPHKLVRTPDTQPRQHHTHSSFRKVVLRARASARCCAPAAQMLFSERLRGWREQQDRISTVTIITINCFWHFSRRPTRPALTGTHIASARFSFTTPISCHVLLRTPDTQPRQHHTHSSSRKVVLRARASARCCTPASPMWFKEMLCELCEHRHRNSMVTIKIINNVRLFSRRPTRLALTRTHLASARLEFHSPPYSAARCSTQACAHSRHPAPTPSHSLQRLQGRA
jgi:hypothetical protein